MYYGEKVIKEIKGDDLVFEDGSKVALSAKQMKYMITEEPKDASELRKIMLDNIVPDIINVLIKHDVKKGDLNAIIQTVVDTFNHTFTMAVGKAFGTYQDGMHPDRMQSEIRMSDIIRINDSL